VKLLPFLLLLVALGGCQDDEAVGKPPAVDPAIERRREAEARRDEARELAAAERMRTTRVAGFLVLSAGAVGTLVWLHRIPPSDKSPDRFRRRIDRPQPSSRTTHENPPRP